MPRWVLGKKNPSLSEEAKLNQLPKHKDTFGGTSYKHNEPQGTNRFKCMYICMHDIYMAAKYVTLGGIQSNNINKFKKHSSTTTNIKVIIKRLGESARNYGATSSSS